MDHRTKGFTLIELLVALAVFVILITMAVPAFDAMCGPMTGTTDVSARPSGPVSVNRVPSWRSSSIVTIQSAWAAASGSAAIDGVATVTTGTVARATSGLGLF